LGEDVSGVAKFNTCRQDAGVPETPRMRDAQRISATRREAIDFRNAAFQAAGVDVGYVSAAAPRNSKNAGDMHAL
jgi:hypothetical protein